MDARQRILTASQSVLVDLGLGAFTMEVVATRSGVAKTTIYRHFEGVNELLVATLDQMIVPFPVPDTGSLREDLLEIAHTVLPVFAESNLRRLLLGIIHAAAGDDDLDRIHRAMMEERKGPIREVVEAAQRRGELPATLSLEVAFDHLEGPYMARWLHAPETLRTIDIEQTIDRSIAAMKALA